MLLPLLSSTQASADAVHHLRHATAALHERLDQGLPLARAEADLADYAQHLVVLRNWQLALAPWLMRTASDLSSLALIAHDLADCAGHANASATARRAAGAVDMAPLRQADDGSDAFCWGVSYVLEGSRLGGQVLYRRLHLQLAPHPLRYLGERTACGPSWAETLASLRRHLHGDAARASGCAGAVAAFEMLLQGFEDAGCLP
ncbi:MAG: hypothetical protein JWP29_1153 [Rhodoferax sp.]|nr:hypothetical protein [Rhodoferax sp.]